MSTSQKLQALRKYGFTQKELAERFDISESTQKNYSRTTKRTRRQRSSVPSKFVEVLYFALSKIEGHPGVNPKKELDALRIDQLSIEKFVQKFKDVQTELLEITIKGAIELLLKNREFESPAVEFRKKYTYLNDETLNKAVVECPELVQRLISDEKVRPLARAHALLALAAGAVDKETFFSTIKANATHPSPFIRESAFMGLFEIYDQEQGSHPELKTFFQESLEKEKAIGIKQKIASLLERM